MRKPASGPSVSAMAMTRLSSTTGDPVRRASSPYGAAICVQSQGVSASGLPFDEPQPPVRTARDPRCDRVRRPICSQDPGQSHAKEVGAVEISGVLVGAEKSVTWPPL
jgi:hypothetical protein